MGGHPGGPARPAVGPAPPRRDPGHRGRLHPGLLASQSRQAAISLILAIGVATLLNPVVRRQSKLLLVACIPLIVALYYSFSLAAKNNPKFNSVSTRVSQIGAATHVWHTSPVLGWGCASTTCPSTSTSRPRPT